jgi:hypothetical protein
MERAINVTNFSFGSTQTTSHPLRSAASEYNPRLHPDVACVSSRRTRRS